MTSGSDDTSAHVPGKTSLTELLIEAVRAANSLDAMAGHLPERPRDRTIVIGAGKAAAHMARVLERVWDAPLSGLVVTRYGHAVPSRFVEVVEASHPVPDAAGLAAARRIADLLRASDEDDR